MNPHAYGQLSINSAKNTPGRGQMGAVVRGDTKTRYSHAEEPTKIPTSLQRKNQHSSDFNTKAAGGARRHFLTLNC